MNLGIVQQSIEVMTPAIVYHDFDRFLEKCGRVCYKSEDKITGDSAEKFIAMIIKSGHESVLEHANLTVKFVTDRAMTHALVRHRHCAFSQESTHYINYRKKDRLQVIDQVGMENESDFYVWEQFMEEMCKTYETLNHIPHKVTRSIFPSAIKTELVMTTNIREWRHILKIRTAPNCHPQMKDLMDKLLHWFKVELPLFVTDIPAGELYD